MRRYVLAITGLMAGLCFLLAIGTATVSASTLTVNSTSDTDDGKCDVAHCSLREAINAANANSGHDTIEFNIPNTDSGYQVGVTGTWTISLTAALPNLSDDETTIDGLTQAVYNGDTNPDGPEIEITGASMASGSCLNITSDNNRIRGLVINRCPWHGIQISYVGDANTISGNYIGTDATGNLDLGNAFDGVNIIGGCQDNLIGGDTSAERNIISGNDWNGVEIRDSGAMSNTISGNYIGTDAAGSSDLGNGFNGVVVHNGAQQTVIGGDTSGEGNVISGNDENGVWIHGTSTMSNTISGNYIGTDASGSGDLGNSYTGVLIYRASQNMIGGDTSAERNVISGNDDHGVQVVLSEAMSNTISGNYIGTDVSGSVDLGNGDFGVTIADGAHNNTIGGDTPGERNTISGNDGSGVEIHGSGTMNNTISGNYIGTDSSGSSDLGNDWFGVKFWGGAQNNVIGGDTVGEGNVIAFNDIGVRVDGATTTGNTITENSIHSNAGLGIDLLSGGNTELTAPTIALADCCLLYRGTAPNNATVELFTDPDEEGKTYLTTVSADGGGDWSFWDSFTLDTYVTATATDGAGNTSEFSTQVGPATCHQVFAPLVMKRY